MKWTPDTPGQPPRLLTEPREDEPLTDAGWPVAALGTLPASRHGGRSCLRCGGGALADYDPECEHVTREGIRERLRASVYTNEYRVGHEGAALIPEAHEIVVEATGDGARSIHPTREGAISLVLDTLVEREVERLRHPLMIGRAVGDVSPDGTMEVPEGESPMPPVGAMVLHTKSGAIGFVTRTVWDTKGRCDVWVHGRDFATELLISAYDLETIGC